MLTIIMGADAAVLSCEAVEHIKEAPVRGEDRWVLIVPEQFSFGAERRLCQLGGNTIGRYAEVLSFSRLADRVAAKVGGAAGAYLDKGGQLLTMALAAEQVASRIKLYAPVLRKPEFLTDMVHVIGEFRSYCLDPSDLSKAAHQSEGRFSQKLEELAILYEAYLAVCANGKADPADKLLRLIEGMDDCRWIGQTRFYIDGFSDFTGAELSAIGHLICCAKEVRVGLTCAMKDSVMHRTAEKTATQLRRCAKENEVPCKMERSEKIMPRHEDVQRLLAHMFSYGTAEPMDTDGVSFAVCAGAEEECRAAALRVKRLLAQGVRCRDIAVACTDMTRYEVPLRNAFRAAQIPAYFAGERGLLSKPVVRAVINCLYAAVGPMDYENVAMYLRSGLPVADRECCDRLDQYAYLWNLRGSGWEKPWSMHPRGFAQQMKPEDETLLQRLNEEKDAVLAPLLQLRHRLQSAANTAQMITALYDFMEAVELRRRLEEKANAYAAQGQTQAAQELNQIYEIVIGSLEQMWLTLGQTERTPEDFCRLYDTVLTRYQVATIPAGLDQVHVSDLPDLRNTQVEHLLVLGAADGLFPSYKTAQGILSEEERSVLIGHGIPVAPGRADQMDQELCRIFFALSATQQTLYLSHSSEQPAWLFRRASALYPGAVTVVQQQTLLNLQELAAWRVRHHDDSPCGIAELENAQKELSRLCGYTFDPLQQQTVRGLYGAPIALSPSRIDQFAACRFAFFLNYGLRAKPRKQAKLDQPAFGTFVHEVLEHTVLRVKDVGGFPQITQQQVLEIAAEEIDRYACKYFPEQAKREEYLFRRSKEEIRDIVSDLWEELRVSKFQPQFCELKFAPDGILPAVRIAAENASCDVIGLVDRVDTYCDGEKTYIRIVDYKTGTKEFDYTDILNGAGLQMLIYLFAMQSCGAELFDASQPEAAGVLYLPAKREYPVTEPMPDDAVAAKAHSDKRRRKGLIRGEDHLLAAMEADAEDPKFMPYKNGKRGKTGDLASRRQMKLLEDHVLRCVAQMADQIVDGDVHPNPIVRGQYGSCNYCDYKTVCHKDLGTHETRVLAQTSAAKFWEILEREEEQRG